MPCEVSSARAKTATAIKGRGAVFIFGGGIMNRIIHGDCLDELKKLPDNSIDSCVTDPPYGLSREPDIREVLTKWMAGEDYTHRVCRD